MWLCCRCWRKTYLANVGVAATFAAKLNTTNGTDNVLIALDLVDQQALFVFEIFVTSAAVLMLGIYGFVFLHLVLSFEDAPAERVVGAVHLLSGCILSHCGRRRW